ncbi:L-lactate dehydrogenase complex protein LldG [Paraburkholderia eburnea]|uniref:L-lactate dehydrogenase complex protein LldG n=1 Tax=Paraburkholderia eburnea TaxID=1189126 RepID=A0A2S4M361_9BURK|nr:LUD domain-containing protein [Paraburkholderia eburnea]POR49144.1 L-lactate dehydrogenase complex protein LldG [Paraburkholderia eburnea]PRZ19521.1 L-lactate dehydrogenase complex protein LldG [Paraburkholderia eburnea]
MASREAFLARVRAAQPAPQARPEVPLFDTPPGDLRARFAAALTLMGGKELEAASGETVLAAIRERLGPQVSIASAALEVPGTRVIDASTPPASLEDVEVGVVRARFGVAETGSVWLSEREYIVNSLGYLVQHLYVLLDPGALVAGLQDAYRRDDFRDARYAALVTGPSATADIEGVLIQGAQGVKSLTVVWLPAH